MFWRGLVGYLPVNIVQALAGFGAIVVFTRLLSPVQYGDYALGFSVGSLASTSLFTWLEAAFVRYYVAESTEDDRKALYGTVYRTFLVMALVLPLASAIGLAAFPLSSGLRFAVAAGLASTIARSLLKLAQERSRAVGEVKRFALVDMAQTGGAFVIGIALAASGAGGAAPLAGVGLASFLCLIVVFPAELPQIIHGRFDPARLRLYAGYGVPVTLSLLMSLAIANTDRFVIAAVMGPGAVGAYHAGYSLANRTLDVMFIWMGMAGGPAAVAALERGGMAALQKVALNQITLMLLIAAPASAGLALVAQPLAALMVGPAMSASAAHVTAWIAASATFAGMTTYYFHTAFTLSRKTRRMLVAMAIPALANLVLALALVPRFGLQGAMWATTAAYAIGMVSSILIGRTCLALPIPWETVARIAAATGVMVVAVLQVPAFGGLDELISKSVVGAIAYAIAAITLDAGGVRRQALAAIRNGRLEWIA